MNHYDENATLKLQELESENQLLKKIIRVQKKSLERMMNHYISKEKKLQKISTNNQV